MSSPSPVIFNAPSSVLFGAGARLRLAEELQQRGLTKLFIVTDAYLEKSGVVADIQKQFDAGTVKTTIFTDVQPDPTDQNVAAGLKLLQQSGADAIVAIGGGSVIDAAKMIGIAAKNPGPLSTFQGYHKIPKPGLPLIAIPTSAGTGSEATKAAVITDTERHVKMMIFDAKLMPQLAIIDYELTLTMPAHMTAHVGVDTLVHGIEAFVSRKANGMTDPLAISCIKLTARFLKTAQQEPANREAREAMSLAALQGGMAFTNSSVCLVHGMSRPIGAVFHLPHGLSNAVLLPAVTRFSIPGATARYARISREMGLSAIGDSDEKACRLLVDGLEQLNKQLGIPRLSECVKQTESEFESHLSKMAEDALASGSPQNNPVVPTAGQIIDLYRRAW